MTLDELQALNGRLAELCRRYAIAELDVSGSAARGSARPGSDIDLLYTPIPGNDLGMDYFAPQAAGRHSAQGAPDDSSSGRRARREHSAS